MFERYWTAEFDNGMNFRCFRTINNDVIFDAKFKWIQRTCRNLLIFHVQNETVDIVLFPRIDAWCHFFFCISTIKVHDFLSYAAAAVADAIQIIFTTISHFFSCFLTIFSLAINKYKLRNEMRKEVSYHIKTQREKKNTNLATPLQVARPVLFAITLSL